MSDEEADYSVLERYFLRPKPKQPSPESTPSPPASPEPPCLYCLDPVDSWTYFECAGCKKVVMDNWKDAIHCTQCHSWFCDDCYTEFNEGPWPVPIGSAVADHRRAYECPQYANGAYQATECDYCE